MEMIGAVLFDLGNVLVNFDLKRFERAIKPYGYKGVGDINDFITKSDICVRYMKGSLTSADFFKKVKNILGIEINTGDFFTAWNSIFYPSKQMEIIVRRIKENYPNMPIGIMSDTNKAHYEFLEREYNFLSDVDIKILSYKVGVVKPGKRIFREAVKTIGARPNCIFYTDDRMDLIEAARAAGFRAFHFKSPGLLAADLRKSGIKI